MKILHMLLRKFGYVLVKTSKVRLDPDMIHDQDFSEIYNECKAYTMVSPEKSFALYKAVLYTLENNLEGDFVECGVWKGGQAMIVAKTLLKKGRTDKKIYLYDTYKGMTEPTSLDEHLSDGRSALTMWNAKVQNDHNEWCYASLEEVKKNVLSTGYPPDKVIFVEGKVEDTIPRTMPSVVALLRLDTDWYESTYHELVYLYPLVSEKGILLIDDYGTWRGSRRAVDQYIKEQNVTMLLTKVGTSGRIGVKIASIK